MKAILLIALCAIYLGGCTLPSTDYSDTSLYTFPKDIRDECYRAKGSAKVCLEALNTSMSFDKNYRCVVAKIDGTKRFGQYWAWYDNKNWNMYVLGMCYGNLIKVACDPNNRQNVSYEVLKHEFGHHWLMLRYNDGGHDSTFSPCFMNWRSPKSIEFIKTKDGQVVAGKSFVEDGLKFITVETIDEDGNTVHIDMVQELE